MSKAFVQRNRRRDSAITYGVIFAGGVFLGSILTYLASPELELASSTLHIAYIRSVGDLEGVTASLGSDPNGRESLRFDSPSIEVLNRDVHSIGVQRIIGFHNQVQLDRVPGWVNAKVLCEPSQSETRLDVTFQVKWDVHCQTVQLGDRCARVVKLPLAPGEQGERYYAVFYLIRTR